MRRPRRRPVTRASWSQQLGLRSAGLIWDLVRPSLLDPGGADVLQPDLYGVSEAAALLDRDLLEEFAALTATDVDGGDGPGRVDVSQRLDPGRIQHIGIGVFDQRGREAVLVS